MWSILKKIFIGSFCDHVWLNKETITLTSENTGKVIGYRYVLQCKKCGEIKFKDSR